MAGHLAVGASVKLGVALKYELERMRASETSNFEENALKSADFTVSG